MFKASIFVIVAMVFALFIYIDINAYKLGFGPPGRPDGKKAVLAELGSKRCGMMSGLGHPYPQAPNCAGYYSSSVNWRQEFGQPRSAGMPQRNYMFTNWGSKIGSSNSFSSQ